MRLSITRVWITLIMVALCPVALAAVLGIDYGQEFTKGSVVGPGAPFEIVLSSDSKRKDLSGISFKKMASIDMEDVQRVYGNSANSLFTRLPENSAFYLKGLLGKSIDSEEAQQFAANFPGISMVPADLNRTSIVFEIGTQNFTVEQLVAMQLENVGQRAAGILGNSVVVGKMTGAPTPVRDVAISVPPHFDSYQRRALKDAADIAGFKLISLVNDGVAVAVNFASTRNFEEKEQYYMIYDVGAGSSKATLVSIKYGDINIDPSIDLIRPGNIIDVCGVGYSKTFGGQLLTSRLRDLLVEKFAASNKADITVEMIKSDAKAYNKFWKEAERAKMVLSANTEVSCSIESVKNDEDFRAKVTRDEFNALTADLHDIATAPINDALNSNLCGLPKPITVKDLSAIIIAGGGTRVPFIQQKLLELVDGDATKISKNVNADEADVLGTTLRGVGISKMFRSKDMQVIDRTLWDYEIVVDGQLHPLFPKGTPLGSNTSVVLKKDGVLELHENKTAITTFAVEGVEKSVQDLLSDRRWDCLNKDEIKVRAVFKLQLDGTVKLSDVSAQCLAQEKPQPSSTSTSSSSATDSVTDSGSDANSSSTSAESSSQSSSSSATTTTSSVETPLATKVSKKPLKYTQHSVGVKGLSKNAKNRLHGMITLLNRIDMTRLEKEQLQNELESTIYRVREFLVSHELGGDHDLLTLSEFQDWLEESSSSASTKELSSKISDLLAFRDKFIKKDNESAESTDTGSEIMAEDKPAFAEPETAGSKSTHAPVDPLKKGAQPSEKFITAMERYKTAFSKFTSKLKEAGVDFEKQQQNFGLDLLNLDNYIGAFENIDSEDSLIQSVDHVTNLINEVIAASASGNSEKVSEVYAKLAARMDERDAISSAHKNEAEKAHADAIKEFFKNAANTLDVRQKMKAQQTETPISHDEL